MRIFSALSLAWTAVLAGTFIGFVVELAREKARGARFRIYHRDREYARELGDPLIGEVWAGDKAHAERIAEVRWNLPTGAWAVGKEDLC